MKRVGGVPFPGETVVSYPPASAGDTGSIPAQGRSHILQGQLSPSATTLEVCSATREATAVRSPRTATREWPPLGTPREKPAQHPRLGTASK